MERAVRIWRVTAGPVRAGAASQPRRQSLDADLQSRLNAETTRLRKQIEAETRSAVSDEVHDLREKLNTATAAEVELRKSRRELEQQTRELELAVNREAEKLYGVEALGPFDEF